MVMTTTSAKRRFHCEPNWLIKLNSVSCAVDRQAGMKATMAHGTRCNRVPCCVGKIRPGPRFAYVGMLAIQPFHYAQDVVADFHHLGGWRARQDLARALC